MCISEILIRILFAQMDNSMDETIYRLIELNLFLRKDGKGACCR